MGNYKLGDYPAYRLTTCAEHKGTTAGYKQSESYNNMMQILCHSVIFPKEAIVLGGDWRLSVVDGALDKNFVKELKASNQFNEATFAREYGSGWEGSAENAFFDSDKFDKQRVLNIAENKYNMKIDKYENDYYVMGVDVGRFRCTTEVVIIKVTQPPVGNPIKQIVNLYTYEEEHFGKQAIQLKRLFNKFKCRCCVVDGNGLGAGLVDFLVTDQRDPDTGEFLPNWGVYNDEDGYYRRYTTDDTVHNAMYIMKATNVINSELYAYTSSQLMNGRLRFLIDENDAKTKLMAMEQSKNMSKGQRDDYLMPYVLTTVLKAQCMNLILNQDGSLIVLKQANPKIKKDKFSALIYGLSFCKMTEDRNAKQKKAFKISDMMLYTKHR